MFFSLFCFLTPILGSLRPRKRIVTMYCAKLINFMIFGTLFGITLGIPTYVASWCWELDFLDKNNVRSRWQQFFVNLFIPLFCFVAFCVHSSVGHGWIYGLYWFIPVLFYLLQTYRIIEVSSFITALKSTFIAHAIGSVIWCYVMPMTADRWISLIPVVAVERLAFAAGMTLVYYAWNKLGRRDFFSQRVEYTAI